jgi:alpha-tubulin suppressor-like RCC1 family protein
VPGNLLLGRDTSGCPADGFGRIHCPTPGLVDGLEGIVAIAAADTHNLALDAEGRVWAWGRNAFGQLGYSGADTRTPVLVSTFPAGVRLVGIAAGGANAVSGEGTSLALAEDGTVWAWGANPSSVFGDPNAPARSTPALVVGLTDVVAIATRARHVLALDAEGVLYGWGSNGSGQVGVPEPGGFINAVTTPTAVLAEVDAFAVGSDYSLARGRDGSVWGWGANNFFKVGASPIPPDPFPPFEVREPVPLEPPATP